MSPHPLNDAMAGRLLAARWILQGKLALTTAAHFGGGEREDVDMAVLRDARSGDPLLPGTTLAGALRSALADRLAGHGEAEPAHVTTLFGGSPGDNGGSQSPLIVFDAPGQLPLGQGFEIRDGVAITPSTGTAEDLKKYDYEVLPAGTTFVVRIELLVPPAGSSTNEASLLAALATAIDDFCGGNSGFGARRSRGLGRVEASWSAKRYDLSTSNGWLEWARSDHEAGDTPMTGEASARNAIERSHPHGLDSLGNLPDQRGRVTIELSLGFAHDVLVRSPGVDPKAPDVSHLRSGGEPILPGTSLAGVLRTHALRIANVVRGSKAEAARWVDRLFGPRFESQRPQPGFQPRRSRLRVGEAKIEGSTPRRQARIAIDRFTQGVVDSALFDEQTEVDGAMNLTLELRSPERGELGLVLLVLKDLLDGRLPVGGSSSVGRGFLSGTGTVWIQDAGGSSRRQAVIAPGQQPTGIAAQAIDEAIGAFHDAPPPTTRQRSDGEHQWTP